MTNITAEFSIDPESYAPNRKGESEAGEQSIKRSLYLEEGQEPCQVASDLLNSLIILLVAALNCPVYQDEPSYFVSCKLGASTGEDDRYCMVTSHEVTGCEFIYTRDQAKMTEQINELRDAVLERFRQLPHAQEEDEE